METHGVHICFSSQARYPPFLLRSGAALENNREALFAPEIMTDNVVLHCFCVMSRRSSEPIGRGSSVSDEQIPPSPFHLPYAINILDMMVT